MIVMTIKGKYQSRSSVLAPFYVALPVLRFLVYPSKE